MQKNKQKKAKLKLLVRIPVFLPVLLLYILTETILSRKFCCFYRWLDWFKTITKEIVYYVMVNCLSASMLLNHFLFFFLTIRQNLSILYILNFLSKNIFLVQGNYIYKLLFSVSLLNKSFYHLKFNRKVENF